MFGSQALETAIGLALLFFILATAASAVLELVAKLFATRARGLNKALAGMVGGETNSTNIFLRLLRLDPTGNVRDVLTKTGTRARASYMSAKGFADAATELAGDLIDDAERFGPGNRLRDKLETLTREARGDLTAVKSGLETWFDETMTSAQDVYKRRTGIFLFLLGTTAAVALNASAINVAHDLWTDTATREAVVDAATKVTTADDVPCTDPDGGNDTTADDDVTAVECALDNASTSLLPVGWSDDTDPPESGSTTTWWATHLTGWLISGLLVMLGAPFWFDLLGRLVALRKGGSSGARPAEASDDPGSNTTLSVAQAPAALAPTAVNQFNARLNTYTTGGNTSWLRMALNLEADPAPLPPPPPPAGEGQ